MVAPRWMFCSNCSPGYIALVRVANERNPLPWRQFDERLVVVGMEAYVRSAKTESAGIAWMMQDP